MKEKKKQITFGKVDIAKSHFLLTYSEKPADQWRPVGVLSNADYVDDMRLSILIHDIKDKPILDKMLRELHFYLFELKNKNNIDYLHVHIASLSNVAYGPIHFSFIPKIDKHNIFYFIETECKLMGIYNTAPVTILQERYVDVVVNNLFGYALDSANQFDGAVYNENIIMLNSYIFNAMPAASNFIIDDALSLVEFSKKLAELDIRDFCNIINYLRKIKLLKLKDVKTMLVFFAANKKLHHNFKTCS